MTCASNSCAQLRNELRLIELHDFHRSAGVTAVTGTIDLRRTRARAALPMKRACTSIRDNPDMRLSSSPVFLDVRFYSTAQRQRCRPTRSTRARPIRATLLLRPLTRRADCTPFLYSSSSPKRLLSARLTDDVGSFPRYTTLRPTELVLTRIERKGRANVGKSTLINKLVMRNKLVRSGQTPVSLLLPHKK